MWATTREEPIVSNEAPDIDVLERLLRSRSSCRAYLPDPVPRDQIERLLAFAQRSASWSNTQPWQIVVTSGEATERFREEMLNWATEGSGAYDIAPPSAYPGEYRERRRECARQLYESVGIEWGDRAASAQQSLEKFRFFGAPHVAIITVPAEFGAYGAVDAGVWIANFVLAAEAMGLGAIPQAALAEHSEQIRRHLGIAADRHVVAGVSFGHPDTEQPVNQYRTPRAALEQVVTWAEGGAATGP